jgi:hypothetical protein
MQIPRSLRELVMTKTKNAHPGSAGPRELVMTKARASHWWNNFVAMM